MNRMKTFGIYLLIFVGFYIFSTIGAYFYIQTTYGKITGDIIKSDNTIIVVEDAKSTIINGYIKGNISNTTDTSITSKYIKFDLISKRGNIILTKYIYVDELKSGETKNFNLNFQAENIKTFKIEIVDHAENQDKDIQIININDLANDKTTQWTMIIGALIWVTWLF